MSTFPSDPSLSDPLASPQEQTPWDQRAFEIAEMREHTEVATRSERVQALTHDILALVRAAYAADHAALQRLQADSHELALIAARVGERGRTDASTPTFIRVENIIDRTEQAEAAVQRLQQENERFQQALAQAQQMADAAEMLWVVLASVSGGDWMQQSAEWQEAAARWRDNYFAVLARLQSSTPQESK